MTDPTVTIELALKHGLNEQEFSEIIRLLGRTPTYTELGMYSVMWSEHCSYKNSIAELKKLPRSGGKLLVKAGEENAGLVDIGDGLAIAFKIESHNHPSAVEPYQGAATGVGGIMRDIFTMGARPIASLNSLRFGNMDLPRTKYLLKGVVKGIGDYGNSFGVPTVAGEVYFDDSYNENPLVNAMALGIVKHNEVARGIARGENNLVFIVGSSTGRDGIHGATFASEEISEESEAKRPSVQVGDPFTEKLLLEATLEAIRAGIVVGIQDMGAAGITCSTTEMSARGKSGMVINLDLVPVREKSMTSYEIMLSESQERMLLVAKPEHEAEVKRIFTKWDLKCVVIGHVINEDRVRVTYQGVKVADVPADHLVLGGGAPVYYRESSIPGYIAQVRSLDISTIPEPSDYNQILIRLLESPNICSRKWITCQYDSMVRTNTFVDITDDAAVIRIKGTGKALAMKTDCNPKYVYLNPYLGAVIAVAESARNVVCVGAKPLAITNCLNFANPYKPENFWQFKEAVRGIGDACRAFDTPVTGGNVSFYNEAPDGPIYPTPVIGMVGEVTDIAHVTSSDFKEEGDLIILLGRNTGHIGGSEYLSLVQGKVAGDAPVLDLENEKALHKLCISLIQDGLIRSAHDLSEGGLGVSLCECAIASLYKGKSLGAEITVKSDLRNDFLLFGEDQSRILISVSGAKIKAVEDKLNVSCYPYMLIGKVVKEHIRINNVIDIKLSEISERYNKSLERRVEYT